MNRRTFLSWLGGIAAWLGFGAKMPGESETRPPFLKVGGDGEVLTASGKGLRFVLVNVYESAGGRPNIFTLDAHGVDRWMTQREFSASLRPGDVVEEVNVFKGGVVDVGRYNVAARKCPSFTMRMVATEYRGERVKFQL